MKPLRTTRLIACGTAYELGTALLKLSKLLEVPTPIAFQNTEQIDSEISFTEGDYSGKRPGFIP